MMKLNEPCLDILRKLEHDGPQAPRDIPDVAGIYRTMLLADGLIRWPDLDSPPLLELTAAGRAALEASRAGGLL